MYNVLIWGIHDCYGRDFENMDRALGYLNIIWRTIDCYEITFEGRVVERSYTASRSTDAILRIFRDAQS